MSNEIDIPVLLENESCLPSYASQGAAGADVRAHIKETIILEPGLSAMIPTGIKAEIPKGFEIQVRPRSGLAAKNQITVLNTPGTIDSDYRGEIQIILINHGKKPFEITPGMRLAQLVVSPVTIAKFIPVGEVSTTTRGSQGFGHTGTH